MNHSYARRFFAGVAVAASRKSNDADEDSDKNRDRLITNRCTRIKKIVRTAYKKGDNSLLERFKYEISRDTADGMTFYDIIEIFSIVNGKEYRVLMFKIPVAAMGIWGNN